MRIITFSHYLAHTQPLFIDLFLLPLDKLILNRIGIIMYKICNGLLPEVINVMYVSNKDIHSYNTRTVCANGMTDLLDKCPVKETFLPDISRFYWTLSQSFSVDKRLIHARCKIIQKI